MKTGDGIRSIMKDRDHNGFEFIKNDPTLEKKIFSVVVKNDSDEIMKTSIAS